MTSKRKRDSKDDADPTSGPALQNKLKESVIDDPVAYQFLKELGVSDTFFNEGKVLAWALQPDEDAFSNITDYVEHGQPDVLVRREGGHYEIMSILRIIPKADHLNTVPLDFNENPKWQGKQRKMLWHGTKKANVISILENGLKLPTGNNNGMYLGEGIYFGDTILQSGNYCFLNNYPEENFESLYLFLCDVVLGEAQKETMYQMDRFRHRSEMPSLTPKSDYDSVKGCGMEAPDPEWNMEIDGCTWPLGLLKKNLEDPGELEFNEYVVYKTEQVQPKFFVKVKFVQVKK